MGSAFYTDVGVGKSRRPRTEEEWNLAVKGLKELSKVAEDYNVILGVEPIKLLLSQSSKSFHIRERQLKEK